MQIRLRIYIHMHCHLIIMHRYNLNVLEEWLREHKLTCALDILQPIVQASKLLQMKKETEDDAKCISEFCANLNTQQV